MKLRSIIAGAIALVLSTSIAFGQAGQGSSPLSIAKGGTSASTASGARTALGLAIGSATQAWDADLDALAALSGTNTIYYRSASNTWTAVTIGGMLSFSSGTINVGDAELSAIAGLTSANNKCFYWTGSGTSATYDCSSFGRSVQNAADASALRTLAGTVIGTDVQAFDAELSALAGLTSANNKCFYFTGSGTAATYDCSSFGRSVANAADASALRTLAGSVIGTDVQAFDADLAALAANSTDGLWAHTGAGAGAARTLTAPAAGLTITNPAGIAGNPTFVLANDLAALEGLTLSGIAVRTATDTWAQRTITGTANEVCVTNGNGVSGDPTLGVCAGFLSTAHTWAGQQTFASPIATGTTDVQEALKLSGDISPTQLAANTNDWAPTGFSTASTVRLSTDASRNITGLAAGADGRIIILHNVGSFSAVLTNEDAASTAANRFLLGGDTTLTTNTSITLRYDATSSRWRAITSPGAGGGGGGVTSVTIAGAGGVSATGTCTVTTSGTCTLTGYVSPPRGRLTLQAGTPVMTTTQSAKTTLYYSAYGGNQIPIYDGTSMVPTVITGGEISVATTDTAKNPAAIGASKVNDWFVWNDAGTLRISHGPDWTSDTARSAGTALVMVNGILLNNASITNGPAASRGTYVGTTRSNASNQLDWIFGASAAGGTAAFLGVWNMYNRVNVNTTVTDSTASWSTGTSATFASMNASAANRISAVFGLPDDGIRISVFARMSGVTVAFANANIGFALDATNTADKSARSQSTSSGLSIVVSGSAENTYAPQTGFHFWQAVDAGDGTNVGSIAGGSAQGLSGMFRM